MMNREQLTPLSSMKDYTVSKEDPDVRGWTVIGDGGERLGTVRDLMIDTSSMKAEYLTMGRQSGESDLFIPSNSARLDESRHEVIVSGAASLEGWRSDAIETGRDRADMDSSDAYRSSTETRAGYDGSTSRTDDRLTRAEEEVHIGKREHERGEVVIGKHVETERVTQNVPVERERVRIERRDVSDARGAAEIADEEIRVPLMEEELVVEKRPVVKEEIVISKERVTDTEQVDTDVRKERVDVSGDSNLIADDRTRKGRR